jgi:hypothetical protein
MYHLFIMVEEPVAFPETEEEIERVVLCRKRLDIVESRESWGQIVSIV